MTRFARWPLTEELQFSRMKDLLLTLLHLAVTAAKLYGPGAVRAVIAENLWLRQQLIVLRRAQQRAPNLSVGDGRGAPRHLSPDHDPLFEAHRWTANLRMLEIDEIKTVPHVPLSHPFVERLIGTMRREFLDHVGFWNARDLERKLADFQTYYNDARVHASLDGHTPSVAAGEPRPRRAELNQVRWVHHCRDLVQFPVAA